MVVCVCECVCLYVKVGGGEEGEGVGGWVTDTEWEAMVVVPDSGVTKAADFHFACNKCY